jgi:Cu(I)/Ag(I) efflux system protein CusF
MVFQVTNPAMLDQLNSGDKIRFSADKVGSAYTVTSIEPVR